jgi:diaminopimelate decarboxylase
MDENTLRENCRKYVESLNKYFGNGAKALFASKACSFKRMYEIVSSENMGVDVVSVGELYTARKAGVNPQEIYFHSNSKTDEDIECYDVEDNHCGVIVFQTLNILLTHLFSIFTEPPTV